MAGLLVLAISWAGAARPLPGSLAGQPGPEGSTWLGIGDETTHGDLTVRLAGIEDRRCPADVECVSAGEVRVHLDVTSGAGARRQVVVVVPVVRGTGSGPDSGPYRLRVASVAPARPEVPFAWHGVALLVEDVPCDRCAP